MPGSKTHTNTTNVTHGGGSGKFEQKSKEYVPFDTGSSTLKWLKDLKTNNKLGAINELRNKIDKVDTHISKHDTTAFIYFEVNNFKLDTRVPDSFKHYAISLSNQKTGCGQGNKFTLKIAYHKHFAESKYSDINMLERALGPLQNASLMNYGGYCITNAQQDLLRNKCILQYGYLTNDNTLISPEYTGLLLKYSVNANKQIVEYTLEGYTGEQALYNTVSWYPNIVGMDSVVASDGSKMARAVLALKNEEGLSESERKELINKLNIEYSGGISFNPYFALDAFLRDYNESTSENSMKFYLIDCTNRYHGVNLYDKDTLEPVRMSICKGQTPLQYAEYCIGQFKYKTTTNYAIQYLQQQGKTTEKFIYSFVRDIHNDKITYICVDVIGDSNNSDSKVAYSFTGYSTTNNLLIDYNLNYDGTVALAIANSYNESIKDNAIYIDKSGAVRKKTSITRDMFVAGAMDEVLIAKQNTWLDKVSCANNCTMTTYGLPFEMSIGTVFKCGVYITDTLHHSSGNCYVTGITDIIENNSFTTKFNMIRLPGRNSSIDNKYDNFIPSTYSNLQNKQQTK